MKAKLTVANFLTLCTLGLTLQTPSPAFAVEKITLWPTVFFCVAKIYANTKMLLAAVAMSWCRNQWPI